VYGDITNTFFPHQVAAQNFDEIYLLAAQTHVMQSYATPTLALETNALAVARLLETIRPTTRIYFAATSEMFGTIPMGQRAAEDFPLAAQSPYAAAKVASHLLCRVYREKGYFIVSGISFNHESCRRGPEFVTRKLGLGVNDFRTTGIPVSLGNIHSHRDWHHSKDTVHGMWLSLQQDTPREYVFASGTSYSVRELAEKVCEYFGVPYDDAIHVTENQKRPWDVTYLKGDPSFAFDKLKWKPEITWNGLVEDICKPKGSL
jgi:GDPmannose 4,6-dehydratase